MVEVVTEWAGKERHFQLTFGGVMDLEEATGASIGEIFIGVSTGTFKVAYVYHTIRLGLIGGGLSIVDAKLMMNSHFDERPYLLNAAVAGHILADLMTGVEPSGEQSDGKDEKISFSDVSQICREFHLSPNELREMRYGDFIMMVRGFNAATNDKAPHISEEEFLDILARYEPEAIQ